MNGPVELLTKLITVGDFVAVSEPLGFDPLVITRGTLQLSHFDSCSLGGACLRIRFCRSDVDLAMAVLVDRVIHTLAIEVAGDHKQRWRIFTFC